MGGFISSAASVVLTVKPRQLVQLYKQWYKQYTVCVRVCVFYIVHPISQDSDGSCVVSKGLCMCVCFLLTGKQGK